MGIRKIMNWIKKEYGAEIPIYVTENGVSDRIGNLDDMHREYYFKHYINQLLKGRTVKAILVYYPDSLGVDIFPSFPD